MDNIPLLRKQSNDLLCQANAVKSKYDGKPENMTPSEDLEFTNMVAEAERLQGMIIAQTKFEQLKKWNDGAITSGLPMGGGGSGKTLSEQSSDKQKDEMKQLAREGYLTYLTQGRSSLNNEQIKAYQADNPVQGGFLQAPQDFQQEVITLVKNQMFIRPLAKVYTVVKAESLGIPALDTDPTDGDWTAELLTGNEETTMSFSKRELRPHPMAKRIKISNKLIRNAAMSAEEVIMDRLAYIIAQTEEKAFLVGDGSDKPLGVFTSSSLGIDSSRDVTAAGAGSTTAIAADDLINTKFKVKAAYMNRGVWIMHRDVLATVRKLKDSNNNYLWTTGSNGFGGATGPGNGLQGTPDMLLDRPVHMSEYAPNTFTTGLYMTIFGDFSRYVIADALDMQIQVLDQLYAETNQTGYILRKEVDGMPTLAEAYGRLKLA